MKDTVVIMGSHPRTRGEFDWTRTDCDLWIFNEALKTPNNHGFADHADAVFQMHEPVIWRNPGNRNDPHHYEWLQSGDTPPVYMQEQYPDVPKAVKYPLDEIIERFRVRYFTSTPSYAIALACFLNYKRIEIYGLEMASNTEYQYQRDGVTLWIGVAKGLGIDVDAHIALFDQPLYGYEGAATLDVERFAERIAELKPDVERLKNAYIATFTNVKAAVDAIERAATSDHEKALLQAVQAHVDTGERLGLIDGALQENMRYQKKAELMKQQSGTFLFSRQEFESAAANLTKQSEEARTFFIARGTELGIVHKNLMSAAKGSKKRAQYAATYRNTLQLYFNASNRVAIYKGAAQEDFAYLNYLDKHIRAAGGAKSESLMLEALQNA